MATFDEWWNGQVAGFGQGVGDISRGAISDVGTAYQQILTQDSGIGPPVHLTGDMVTTHETPPVALTHRELQSLINTNEIGQQAEAERIEADIGASGPEASMEIDR